MFNFSLAVMFLILTNPLVSYSEELLVDNIEINTKFYESLDMHRYGTNADWVIFESEIKGAYLDTYPYGGMYKISFHEGNLVKWVEKWNREDNSIDDPNFDLNEINIVDHNRSHLFFIEENKRFSEINYGKTESIEHFYMYDKEHSQLWKCHQYIRYRTELFYDETGYANKICHYDREEDGETIIMKNCKSLHDRAGIKSPRKLLPGEIPYF